jgi:hypothetical protein
MEWDTGREIKGMILGLRPPILSRLYLLYPYSRHSLLFPTKVNAATAIISNNQALDSLIHG